MRFVKKFFQFFSLFVMVLAIPVGLFVVQNEVKLSSQAGGTPAKIVVDVSGNSPALSNWKNLSQGGEESENPMLASVITPLKKLDIDYIRLDHLYDFYDIVSRGADGRLVYNWTELDKTVDDITAIGAKPFFSLSYTPKILAGNNTDMPSNLNDWRQIVAATINHYSGRAERNMTDIYYEVWNEPDLFGQFKMGGAKNYLDLYRASALGAADATNTQPFRFGGPATTALYKNWIEELIKYASDNRLRLDFISWHRYSESMDDFERDGINARIWASAFPDYSDVELIISEAGIDSANNPEYDKRLSAIHTLAMVATTASDVEKIFSFEAKDGPGPTQYWGRWGILTHEKYGTPVEKDRFKALEFLNQMGDTRISVTGLGSWVKAFGRKNGTTAQVLIVNYDASGKHIEAVPVTFENLTGTRFILKRTDFGGRVVEVPTEVTGSSFQTIQYFPANTAAILELIPRP